MTRGKRPLDQVREVYGSYLGTQSYAHDKHRFGPLDHGATQYSNTCTAWIGAMKPRFSKFQTPKNKTLLPARCVFFFLFLLVLWVRRMGLIQRLLISFARGPTFETSYQEKILTQ